MRDFLGDHSTDHPIVAWPRLFVVVELGPDLPAD